MEKRALTAAVFGSYECTGSFMCGEHQRLINYRLKPGWRELVTVLACIQVGECVCIMHITYEGADLTLLGRMAVFVLMG
jgi:hypothetical protein